MLTIALACENGTCFDKHTRYEIGDKGIERYTQMIRDRGIPEWTKTRKDRKYAQTLLIWNGNKLHRFEDNVEGEMVYIDRCDPWLHEIIKEGTESAFLYNIPTEFEPYFDIDRETITINYTAYLTDKTSTIDKDKEVGELTLNELQEIYNIVNNIIKQSPNLVKIYP